MADGRSFKELARHKCGKKGGGETGRECLRAAVGEDHEPGLEGLFGPVDGGDAGAEGEAFEGFWGVLVDVHVDRGWEKGGGLTMKGNSNQENHKVAPDGHAQGHANKDAVEEDADLQQHALENALLVLLLGSESDSLRLEFVQCLLGRLGFVPAILPHRGRFNADAAGARVACDGRHDGCVAAMSAAN